MKYLHLVWSALLRRKTRTLFTIFAASAAFLLFGLLDSVRAAFASSGQSVPGATRLITMSTQGLLGSLPLSLLRRIQAVPGVSSVTYESWFGGYYQTPKNELATQSIAGNYFDVYPEYRLSPAELRALHATRTGAVAGAALAAAFHWKVGDKIPVQATVFPQKNGSNTWIFDLVGIYHVSDPREQGKESQLFFNWDYFDQATAFGGGAASFYIERAARLQDVFSVGSAVDALSVNSDHETKTQSEDAFTASLARRFADIGLIVGSIMGAVFFTLILLTGNTMAQAVRERTPELAILKTIGFSGRGVLALLLAESVLLLAVGGILGLALSVVAVSELRARLGAQIPVLPVGSATWLRGVALMFAVGIIVGVLPAWRGMRVRIVEALSGR
ncbi:MAG TPA: ABC transporter permease [Steroidobacteraceae bacterium]|nr:ABC transporter permease [Steroidobacteraceae bacterium]